MPISDLAIVGQPIIDEQYFGDGFRDDFTALSIEPLNSTVGNRLGTWKRGFMHAHMAPNGFIYGSDENPGDNFVHAAINFENQVYDDSRKPDPNVNSPYTISNSVLKIESTPIATDWARVKDYVLNPDGSLGAFERNHAAAYKSGMLSTYGRFGMSFGRFRARVKTPYGADGASADVNLRKAVFPAALWTLQDIPYGCDINGEPFGDGNTTYRGARPNGGGILFEIDGDENFGESTTALHQTVHTHPPGTAQGASTSFPKTIDIGQDLRSIWRETGFDVYQDKIIFFVNGVYTHEVATPDEIANGLPLYDVDLAEPWNPVIHSPNIATVLGRQTYADSTTRYMHHVLITNLARDGKYPRDLAKQVVDSGGTLPAHQDTVSMEIDWIEARPLLTDNPDKYPIVELGVYKQADGSPPVSTQAYTPRPLERTNFAIYRPDEGVKSNSFFVEAILPATNTDPDAYTYLWTAGAGISIIGDNTQHRVEMAFDNSIAAGTEASRTITLDVNLI